MLAGEGEMIPPVEELVVSGLECSRLREDQEGALAVAAALQVAQDVRDVVEVCAAQLVREILARSVPMRHCCSSSSSLLLLLLSSAVPMSPKHFQQRVPF